MVAGYDVIMAMRMKVVWWRGIRTGSALRISVEHFVDRSDVFRETKR